jgi:hypothetical protein
VNTQALIRGAAMLLIIVAAVIVFVHTAAGS